MYLRYVDDTFSFFDSINYANAIHTQLNSLHLSLQFTMEMENRCTLSILDVLVERKVDLFITSDYRKSTFADPYTNWHSFVPNSCKINLISNLIHRCVDVDSTKNWRTFIILFVTIGILRMSLNALLRVRLNSLKNRWFSISAFVLFM